MAAEKLPGSSDDWYRCLQPLHLIRHNREELAYIAAEPLRTPAVVARRIVYRLRHQKPIGYIGWLGHRSLGDEAMYQSIARAFSPVPVIPMGPAHVEAGFARAGLGGRDLFRSILLGGGTLINPLFLKAAMLAKNLDVPLHTAGTGVGSPGFGMPLEVSLEGWEDALSNALVSVRGPLSQRRLQDIGLAHTVVIGDPALGFTPDTPPPFRTRKRLILNLTAEPGAQLSPAESAAFACAGAIARQFVRSGGEVVGVALGNRDRAVLAKFRSEYNLPMPIENHRTSGERLLLTLAGSAGLIGMRLHSSVLACCAGVPSIVLAYRQKCTDFMASMNMSDFALALDENTVAREMSDRWNQIVSQPNLNRQIYATALSWKNEQRLYYRKVMYPAAKPEAL